MGEQIKGLSRAGFRLPDRAERELMLRYANGDWDRDIEECVELAVRNEGSSLENDRKLTLYYFNYLLFSGRGDKKKAQYWLRKLYNRGCADAQAQYAYYYYTGQFGDHKNNKNKAIKLFNKALNKYSVFAEYWVGEAFTYETSEHNIEAYKLALPYYEEAYKKGVYFARYKLACCYIATDTKLDVAEKLLEKCENPEAEKKLNILRSNRDKASRK